jgi:ribonucleoside-diphosphate reductase alpha chain
MAEWHSLYESKSGERGIFNREAAIRQVEKIGRRDTDHQFGCNPCSEIILRDGQFCNLTEVVVREEDSGVELQEKMRLATILGTFKASLTNLRKLRAKWVHNTEEEALLGVSLTGIMDNQMMNSPSDQLADLLESLKLISIQTNKMWAKKLGINQAAATTAIKPSGTVPVVFILDITTTT